MFISAFTATVTEMHAVSRGLAGNPMYEVMDVFFLLFNTPERKLGANIHDLPPGQGYVDVDPMTN